MNYRSTTTNQKPTSSFTPIQTGFLQRKGTSCSQRSIDSGESNCTQQKNSLQRKLTIGASNDPLEQEADRIADQVLAAPANTTISTTLPRIQRFTEQATNQAEVAPASVDRVLSSSGSPLEPGLQQDMSQRFGHDFSRVRVHTGVEADRSAQDVNANAYTVGHNIVFGAGLFTPETNNGRRLLAHELTHVVQQSGSDRTSIGVGNDKRDQSSIASDRESEQISLEHLPFKSGQIRALPTQLVQRQTPVNSQNSVSGPKATATPSDWKDKVSKATTSTDRVALIQSVVSPVKVLDKTVEAAKDAAVNPLHCIKWDDANPTVSYDDGLNTKTGRSANAGYTKEVTSGPSTARKTDFYIVLGSKVLDDKDLTKITLTLNHEFDHVRKTRSGSTLTGDESEIETWTTTFVREFHRLYSIRDRSDGITSYIDPRYESFTTLGGYYARSTDTTVKANTVKKIADYYNTTIKPHAVHDKVFRYWIHRGINALGIAALCGDVNDKLGKIVDPTKPVKDYWEMPTAIVKAATFTGPPVVTVP
jgi:hypothetical protein